MIPADMTEEQKDRVDRIMKEEFGVGPSSPTDHKWVDLGNGVWIRSYSNVATQRSNCKPELYMVHFLPKYERLVIYHAVNSRSTQQDVTPAGAGT